MIRQLVVEGVTVFPKQEAFSFVPGINVIVGGNDSGKSHLMKLCYALSRWSNGSNRRELPEIWAEEKRLRQILLRVFGTHDLSALTARNRGNGLAKLHCSLEGHKVPLGTAELDFSFTAGREEEGLQITRAPQRYLSENSVFISPREVLSIYPCYIQAGKRYPELLDSASWELCNALEDEPGTDTPMRGALRHVMQGIEKLLSGRLLRINGRFYLQRPRQEPIELNLVAEGFKRIGTLGLLIGNGTVRPGTSLFWDEPEMNLNTIHMPALVGMMMGLCRAGVQLMITTHSLFLLRELVIRLAESSNRHTSRHFIGLQPPRDSHEGVRCSSGDKLSEIDRLESLDAETEQADRYLSMSPEELSY